jgi:hypothetical protein
MQGHLKYHLSSTSLVINGIDNLDATEVLRNTIFNAALTKVTLQEMLYWIKLEIGAPLFLQLTQRASGEVDTVIPNTPEAELKALQINHQVMVWCLNYWADTNTIGLFFVRYRYRVTSQTKKNGKKNSEKGFRKKKPAGAKST